MLSYHIKSLVTNISQVGRLLAFYSILFIHCHVSSQNYWRLFLEIISSIRYFLHLALDQLWCICMSKYPLSQEDTTWVVICIKMTVYLIFLLYNTGECLLYTLFRMVSMKYPHTHKHLGVTNGINELRSQISTRGGKVT